MRQLSLAGLLTAGLLAGVASADAQDYGSGAGGHHQYVIDLGGGGMMKPKYPGADSYMFVPFPIVEVSRLYVPLIGQTEKGKAGFFIYPSFGYNAERKASDDSDIKGTKTIPWGIEAGLGVGFRNESMRTFLALRQGFNGTEGQVGDAGIDLLAPLTSRVVLAVGPRVTFASQDYMETYFGVTAKEAAAGPLTAYKPDGGFKSVGLAASVSYAITDRTRIHVKGGYERLVGKAADSPIVKAGSRDQWMVGAGLSYRFAFDLFR